MPRDRFFIHIYLHAHSEASINSSYFWLGPFVASGDVSSSEAEGDAVLFVEGLLSVFFANVQHSEPQIAAFWLNETHSDHVFSALRDAVVKHHLLVAGSCYFTDNWTVYFEAFDGRYVFTENSWDFPACSAYFFHSRCENLGGTKGLVLIEADEGLVSWLSIVLWIEFISFIEWRLG